MSICLRINAQTSIRSRYQCCCLYLRWFLLHGVHPQRPSPHFCEMWVSVGCHSLLQSHSSLLLLWQIDPLEPETDLQSLASTSWLFEPRESSRPSSSTKYETTIFWSRARPLSNPACCPISTPRPINSTAPCLFTVICSLPQGKTTSHSSPDPGPCLHCPLGEPYASTFLLFVILTDERFLESLDLPYNQPPQTLPSWSEIASWKLPYFIHYAECLRFGPSYQRVLYHKTSKLDVPSSTRTLVAFLHLLIRTDTLAELY